MPDDGVLWSEHERQLELERRHAVELARAAHPSPRVARIQAKRDIKVARARQDNADTKMTKIIASAVVAVIIAIIGGCTVDSAVRVESPPSDAKIEADLEKWLTCLDKNGEPDYAYDEVVCSRD